MSNSFFKSLFQDLASILADTLFPIACLGCGDESNYICIVCLKILPALLQQVCIICGRPSPRGSTHNRCIGPGSPDGLLSCFDYNQPLTSKLIVTGKYKFVREIFRTLSDFTAPLLAEMLEIAQPDFISYIPLHPTRQRWRGFNQAKIIAESWSDHAALPVFSSLLRLRPGRVQKNLSKAERLSNLHGIFEAAEPERFAGRSILLIDDVSTTGSTLLEACQTLKSAGAAQVWCATLAREL